MHLYFEMYGQNEDGTEYLASTLEQMVMCVDLAARKGCEFPDDVASNISKLVSEQIGLAKPEKIGRKIGIRRK